MDSSLNTSKQATVSFIPSVPDKSHIVDIGGSYKKLCNNLGGQYVPLEVNTDIAINPFDLPKGETKPSSEKIKFLLGLVELMTKETDACGLNKLQRSVLEEAIQEVYETSEEPILTDLKKSITKKLFTRNKSIR